MSFLIPEWPAGSKCGRVTGREELASRLLLFFFSILAFLNPQTLLLARILFSVRGKCFWVLQAGKGPDLGAHSLSPVGQYLQEADRPENLRHPHSENLPVLTWYMVAS